MPRKNPKKAQEINSKIETFENAWHDNKNTYNEYTQFIWGNQWLDEEARVFETYKKIPLTFNKLAPMANYLLGEQQQNTPSIECVPKSEDMPTELIDVYEALVDDITFDSRTKEVFQCAFNCAITGGYGAYYVDTEYEDEFSFNQVLRFKEIVIPTRCFWDHSAMSKCKTDGMFCGFKTRMSRTKFRAIYGKKIEIDIPPSNIEEGSVFNDDESVTLVTYWERKYNSVNLYQLSSGRTVDQDEFALLERVMVDDKEMILDDGQLVTIETERRAPRYTVKKYLYAGDYELDASKTPFKQLPMPFVDQKSFYNKQGQQVCRPFFKDTKDAQRYINYLGTQSAYLVKIGRYDQFLVSKENVRSNDTQAIWRDPSNVQGGLIFDPAQSGFVPQQLRPPELSQSLVQQFERAERDIQTCTGMYASMMGEQGNETSKLAIDARAKRGSFNTNTPFDNLNKAIAVGAELVNEGIPVVYDTVRTISVNLKDRGRTAVEINKPMDEFGGKIQHDISQAKFSIRLVPGPGWEGQKQEALNSMQMVLQNNPQLFNLMADLFVENLPLANNIELRNRLKTIVPPEIIEAGKTGEPVPPKPQQPDPMVMAKMQELQLKEKKLQQDQERLQLDSHKTQQEIAMKWEEIQAQREEAAAELQEMILRYNAEAERTQSQEQMAHANNLVKLLTHAHKPRPEARQ